MRGRRKRSRSRAAGRGAPPMLCGTCREQRPTHTSAWFRSYSARISSSACRSSSVCNSGTDSERGPPAGPVRFSPGRAGGARRRGPPGVPGAHPEGREVPAGGAVQLPHQLHAPLRRHRARPRARETRPRTSQWRQGRGRRQPMGIRGRVL